MLKIKRYRIRDGFEPPKRVYCNLGYNVSVLQDWSNRESDSSSDTWDLDWFIVLDEDFCQPYTAFYKHIDDDIDEVGNDALKSIVAKYNRFMSSLEWLEEK